jgi:hypothetical protein
MFFNVTSCVLPTRALYSFIFSIHIALLFKWMFVVFMGIAKVEISRKFLISFLLMNFYWYNTFRNLLYNC